MSENFRFKRFTICQDGVAMKVGTDGVLLGAWCGIKPGWRRALDIGTGTGVIAVMLAQRGESSGLKVDAVEIDTASAVRALLNAEASPWRDRIRVYGESIREFAGKCVGGGVRYDLIVSNPPYFTDSLLPPDKARTTARHTTDLGFSELSEHAASLLSPGGVFALVLPYQQADMFISLADGFGLVLTRRTDVYTKPGTGPKRALLEFGMESGPEARTDTLTIEGGGICGFSDGYISLTRDFYLKF